MGSDFQIFTFSINFIACITLAYIYVGTRFKLEKRSHALGLLHGSNGIRKRHTVLPQSQSKGRVVWGIFGGKTIPRVWLLLARVEEIFSCSQIFCECIVLTAKIFKIYACFLARL